MSLICSCLKVLAANDQAFPKVSIGQFACLDPKLPPGIWPTPAVLVWETVVAVDTKDRGKTFLHSAVVPETANRPCSGTQTECNGTLALRICTGRAPRICTGGAPRICTGGLRPFGGAVRHARHCLSLFCRLFCQYLSFLLVSLVSFLLRSLSILL